MVRSLRSHTVSQVLLFLRTVLMCGEIRQQRGFYPVSWFAILRLLLCQVVPPRTCSTNSELRALCAVAFWRVLGLHCRCKYGCGAGFLRQYFFFKSIKFLKLFEVFFNGNTLASDQPYHPRWQHTTDGVVIIFILGIRSISHHYPVGCAVCPSLCHEH